VRSLVRPYGVLALALLTICPFGLLFAQSAADLPDPAFPVLSLPASGGQRPVSEDLDLMRIDAFLTIGFELSVAHEAIPRDSLGPGISLKPISAVAQAAESDVVLPLIEDDEVPAEPMEWTVPDISDVELKGLLDNEHYRDSLRYKKLADTAFDYGDYDAAAAYAAKAAAAAKLSDEYVAQKLKARADELARQKAEEDAKLKAQREADARLRAEQAAAEALRLRQKAADEAIARAKDRLDWAKSVNAAINYPTRFSEASSSFDAAQNQRSAGAYEDAVRSANRVVDLLADVKETAPLPAQYVVRTWAKWRDCFWNIAGRDYVFGDPRVWKKLYEANKSKLPRPNNPDLLLPGTVLDIPSLYGEVRQGVWSPDTVYSSLDRR